MRCLRRVEGSLVLTPLGVAVCRVGLGFRVALALVLSLARDPMTWELASAAAVEMCMLEEDGAESLSTGSAL